MGEGIIIRGTPVGKPVVKPIKNPKIERAAYVEPLKKEKFKKKRVSTGIYRFLTTVDYEAGKREIIRLTFIIGFVALVLPLIIVLSTPFIFSRSLPTYDFLSPILFVFFVFFVAFIIINLITLYQLKEDINKRSKKPYCTISNGRLFLPKIGYGNDAVWLMQSYSKKLKWPLLISGFEEVRHIPKEEIGKANPIGFRLKMINQVPNVFCHLSVDQEHFFEIKLKNRRKVIIRNKTKHGWQKTTKRVDSIIIDMPEIEKFERAVRTVNPKVKFTRWNE